MHIHKKILIVLSVLAVYKAEAQNHDSTEIKIVEDIPRYNNGDFKNFRIEIEKILKFPAYAVQNNIYGRVFVRFTIDGHQPSDLKVNNIYVVKGVHPSLDYVAKQIVKEAPDFWNCRLPRGRTKAVTFTFPVDFRKENFDSSKITSKYDKAINNLFLLDSLTLDSLLYKSWPVPPFVNEVVQSSVKPKLKPEVRCNEIFNVTGKIVNEFNEPFSYVAMAIKGTRAGTITNPEGGFELEVPCNREIEISFIGYYPQKFIITHDMMNIKIRMRPAYKEILESSHE